MRCQQNAVERQSWQPFLAPLPLSKACQDSFCQDTQLDVGRLRTPLEQIKRRFSIYVIHRHQDALRLFDDSTLFGNYGDRFGDRLSLAVLRPSFTLVHGYLVARSVTVRRSANQYTSE
jgi:hypothetical protein